jgi:levanase/fructan beta-fructosidase
MFALPVDNDPDRIKWVVIDGNGDYVLGRFDGRKFTAETKKRKGDYGRNFYATMTFENMPQSDLRRIQLAWMRGWEEYPKNMPFNQQVSFACELSLRSLPQGLILCRYPIREITSIHGETFSLNDFVLTPGINPLYGMNGDLFDINVKVDLSQSTCSEIALDLHGNTVKYDVQKKILHSVGSEAYLDPRDSRIEIRILMDRLSIETFGNRGEVSITNIAYQKNDNHPLKISAIDGRAKIISLTACKIKSIWE